MSQTPNSADDAVAAFEEAARITSACPLRRGSVVWIGPEAADDVVTSFDLHGHRPNFEAILRLADLDARPRRHLILQEVCHGGPTYSDGGCMSHRMLEDVARLVVRHPNRVHFLLSNHELAEATDFPIMKGRRMLNVVFRMGLVNAYGADADRVRRAAVDFIRVLPLGIAVGDHVFASHSLPEHLDLNPFDPAVFERPLRPSDLREGGPAFRVVWGRDFRAENAAEFSRIVGGRLLLHGHEPCPDGYRVPNDRQMIVDCCAEPAYCVVVPTTGPVDQPALIKSLVRLEAGTA